MPRVTMKELILALATSRPLSRPTRAPPTTADRNRAGEAEDGLEAHASGRPAKVITVPMERSSWPQIITTVKPMATRGVHRDGVEDGGDVEDVEEPRREEGHEDEYDDEEDVDPVLVPERRGGCFFPILRIVRSRAAAATGR